jgi:hypothetical protein
MRTVRSRRAPSTSITRIALQALDYLPPVDVQFIDYARAVLHAHRLSAPTDEEGPSLMTEVFARRGLRELEEKGIQRREQLLDFGQLVAEGQVGLTEEGAAEALDVWQPAIVGRQVGGALQLEVVPHVRHG